MTNNCNNLILNPAIKITDNTVINVESEEQFDKVCNEFGLSYNLSFKEMHNNYNEFKLNSISLHPSSNEWCNTKWYEERGYKVLNFEDIFIGSINNEIAKENNSEIKQGTIVKAIRYDLTKNIITQGVYYGKCNDKHLIDYNGTSCTVVDEVEIIPTLTKKEAKQKVSELFGQPNKVTSKQIRDIIDLIEEK